MNYKKHTLSQLKTKLIVRNILYAIALFVYAFMVWYDNTQINDEYSGGWSLLAVIFMFVCLALCFCEMRIVDRKGNLILPLARFFLFGGKVLCGVATVLLVALTLQWWTALVVSVVMLSSMLIAICILMTKLSKDTKYYIDYTLATLKADSKLRSPTAGIIVYGIMLLIFTVWIVVAIIINETSYSVLETPIVFLHFHFVALCTPLSVQNQIKQRIRKKILMHSPPTKMWINDFVKI